VRTRLAAAILVASIVVLIGVLVAWRASVDEAPRADLVGASGSTSVPVTTTTSTPPPAARSTLDLPTTAPFTAAPAPAPTVLDIPDLGVHVPIRPVGLLADGSMEIPAATEAGWFSPGTRPGAPFGSAVIAAHIDYDGRPGAFFRLRELPLGARVTVTRDDGSTLGYVVVERTQVPKAELPTDELFRTTGGPMLTLITCGGAFDAGRGHYEDNIVVRAAPS
jgi:sortase (surface protein transpeptidase)